MNKAIFDELKIKEIDIEGAIARLSGDESLYGELLTAFPKDDTMSQLASAIEAKDWDGAFTAAHALKGLAGNLGLTPFFHSLGELVISIRTGRIKEIYTSFSNAKKNYDDIVNTINGN